MESQSRKHAPGSFAEVAGLAWPIVVGMLSYTAMGVADTLLMGQVGKTEVAAVGLGTTAFFLLNSFFLGALQGVKVVASQATGAKEHDRALSAAWSGAALALPMGLVIMGLVPFGGMAFEVAGGSQEIGALAARYFGIRALGSPLWYGTVAILAYFQSTGDAKTPMKINLLGNGTHILVACALVFGWGPLPEMGVSGAAWANVVAVGVELLVALGVFARRKGWSPSVSLPLAREILRLGLPMGVHHTLSFSGFAVFTSMIAQMGEDALAAHQVALRIVSVSFLPGYGISEAACVLVGQYVGAREPHNARKAYKTALGLSLGLMGAAGLVFFAAPAWLVGLFQDDPAVLEIGVKLLGMAALFQLFDAVAMTSTGALNGAGETRFTMAASILVAWLVMVPSGWFFGVHLGFGPSGAWAGILLEVASLAAVMSWRFWHSPKLAAADMPAAGASHADAASEDEAQAVKAAA